MEGEERGGIPWKVEDCSDNLSDKTDVYESNNANDLLYMYSAKEMMKVESKPRLDPMEGYFLTQKTSNNKPWKLNALPVTTANITDVQTVNHNLKESLIRLKCKEELFDNPGVATMQIGTDVEQVSSTPCQN